MIIYINYFSSVIRETRHAPTLHTTFHYDCSYLKFVYICAIFSARHCAAETLLNLLMMKKIAVFSLLLCTCALVFAQNLHVTQNSFERVSVSFTSDMLSVEDLSTAAGTFSLVGMKGFGISNNPGAPQFPQLSKLLQIPVCDSVIANIVDAHYEEYDAADLGILHPLWPSQPSVEKNTTPPFTYNQSIYNTNAFYALPLVQVEMAGIRRDIALADVHFTPVQYNPVTQRIRIYTQIDVEFTFANADTVATENLRKYASPMFSLDSGLVINRMTDAAKDEYHGAPIKYLIIANAMFASNARLADFVTWKRRLGYLVEVAYTSDASVGTTTTSIKNYIQNKYNNATAADPAPTFLLLIGDVAQLPAFTGQSSSSHVTDLYYATLEGNDNLPDLYYGRLSATSAAHLTNQLNKIMMYESYSMPEPSYLGKAVLIAGTDGNGYSPTHADGQVNYIYNNYINTNSTTHNYTTVYKHNYNCSSQAATIRNEINAGVGLANYTAHGSSSGWAEPAFSTSHVNSMTNANKYGLLIGNCCLSGKFDDNECFGEALLRAANKGAVGYIGASNSSYWNEDVYWAVGVRSTINASMSYSATQLGVFDKMFHTHGEAYSNWVSTIGGIVQGGNLSVQSSSSSRKLYYWEIYHCFGDPGVRVFLGMPSTMTVTADATIPVSSSTYTVQAAPYAYVALKKDTTQFIAAAFANATGTATLTLPATLETGDYELVALAQNYIPYFQDVEIVDDGACPTPSGMSLTNVTAFTATLSWMGNGDSYNIQTKTTSTDWTTVATGVTTTTYLLTGLLESTAYQVRVQSVCGSDSSYWKVASFTTPVACPTPTGLTCHSVTTTSATLGWTENGGATTWELQYSLNNTFAAGTYTQVIVNGTPTDTLSGLTAETTYYARVKAVCGGYYGESQWSDICTFMPTAIQTVEIGTGNTTSNYLPSYSYYKYALSQQLYTPAEIGTAGTIYSISFYNEGNEEVRNYDIYMVNTSKTAFSSTTDWISVSNANKVFSGTVTMTANAWTTLTLSTPFVYNGSNNLALIADDNTGSYTSSPHMSCQVYTGTSNCAIYKYNDNTNYDPAAPGVSGTRLSAKNHIKISILPSGPHIVPSYVNISGTTAVCPGDSTTLTASSDVDVSYLWSTGATGETITAGTGTYTVTVTSSTGDQLSTSVTVAANPVYNLSVEAEICEGNSYDFAGQILTSPGTYTQTLQTVHGCDSIVTLTLKVSYPTTGEITVETAEPCYVWNGQSYCESGDYVQTLQTPAGCDSVVTLHLTTLVGVEAYDIKAVHLVPNPTRTVCRIVGLESEPESVDIYDMWGKLLMRTDSTEFYVHTLSTGIYTVRVTSGNRIINLKLVCP